MTLRTGLARYCVIAAAAAILGASLAAKEARAAAAHPYSAVVITPPVEVKDPDFVALRKQITEAATDRSRAALAKLTVAHGFFWAREGRDVADAKKSGFDNLAVVLRLTSKESIGWDMLIAFADDPSASTTLARKGAMCAPAEPGYDVKAFRALLAATHTDISDWGFPVSTGVEVHAVPGGGELIEKLPAAFIRLLAESPPKHPAFLRVVTASGRIGYVLADKIAPIGNDQVCYVKDGEHWKIGGYVGAGGQQ